MSPNNNDRGVVEQVLAAEQARCRALSEGDLDALSDLLGDEFTYAHAGGRADSKAEHLEAMRTKPRRTEIEGISVLPYGEVAVTQAKHVTHLTPNPDGSPRVSYMQVLQVWVKRDDRWQLVARQGTRLKGE